MSSNKPEFYELYRRSRYILTFSSHPTPTPTKLIASKMPVNKYSQAQLEAAENSFLANNTSIGTALTDALDAFITSGQMEPQVALKVLATFDRVVAEVLAEKVKARLSFKVHHGFSEVFQIIVC